MITYACIGRLPPEITAPILGRIRRSFQGVRKVPRTGAIGLRFITPVAMQRLNRQFRQKNRPTDVLSFSVREGVAFPSSGEQEIGDVVVCAAVARAEARRRKMDPQEELVRLIVHGTLHLAGYDHATEKEEDVMFGIQERVIAKIV